MSRTHPHANRSKLLSLSAHKFRYKVKNSIRVPNGNKSCGITVSIYKGKGDPLQTWTGPEGSRKLRFPDFVTTAQDDGKVVNPMHRPPLLPRNILGTHFC